MSNKNLEKRVFTYDGVKYAVIDPPPSLINQADRLRSRIVGEELREGTLLRSQLESELRKRKLWTDDMEKEYKTLQKEVTDGEYKLTRGGISLSAAKAIALDMKEKRHRMVVLLSSRTELDSDTCEGKGDAARFNFLFANSLVYEDTGEKYFKGGLDEYLKNSNDPVAAKGGTEFFYLISRTEDVDSTLAENQFLKKYKFADDKGRLIDKEGKLVDSQGRHIDEEGYYIKWLDDGTSVRVDSEGRPIKDNKFIVEELPFLDDDGNAIVLEDEVEEKPKKRTRKKNDVDTDTDVESEE